MQKDLATYNTWNSVHQSYQDKFMDMDIYNESYSYFCDALLATAPKILDIGCGPGNITRYLSQQKPDAKLLGIDYAPNMIQLAKLNVPTARFRVLQAQELHKIEQKFEGIISGFLIPYLSKSALQNFIKNINLLLQDNGVVYLSFVEGNYEQSNYQVSASGNKVYFHYYTSEEVKEYLLQYNITLLKTFLIPYPDTNNLGTQIHTAMIAQKAIQ